MCKDNDKVIGDTISVDDIVYGLVYGKGFVRSIWKDSHYKFEVEYSNGQIVPYTNEGVPAWSTNNDELVTIFDIESIDLMEYDFLPAIGILKPKKIIKLRNDNNLCVRCPSGIWRNVKECPYGLIEEYLENKQFHLFKECNTKDIK